MSPIIKADILRLKSVGGPSIKLLASLSSYMLGYLAKFIMEKEIKHIHLLGICGTGMGALAGLFTEKGYTVTGTDQASYPPMSVQLKNLGIKPNIGYSKDNLSPKPDLVIVGNVITKDNPEVKELIDQKVPYLSMPQAVKKLFLKDKESIVVTGTHGKTTTTNLIAWLLTKAGKDPGFLIGGVGVNFGVSFKTSEGDYFVIEGDEYDTAFFDKGPKFLHYKPKYAIISSIEFDHADIYKDLFHIKSAFTKFLETIPKEGLCLVNADSPEITSILDHANCKIVTYGFSDCADYKICEIGNAASNFCIRTPSNQLGRYPAPMAGRHNILNTTAAIALLSEIGLKPNDLIEGLKQFKGVKRRQEVKGIVNSITVIDDFAHHPTAVRETIDALKKKYTQGRLWTIFEPRSNTTRRKVFEDELAASFDNADKAIIADVFHSSNIPPAERLDPEVVVDKINKRKVEAYFIPKTPYIVEFVIRNALPNDTVLIMSNGAFDNIHEKLIEELKKRRFSN